MKLRIVLVGKTKQAFVKPAVDEYRKRCGRYVQLQELILSDGRGNVEQVRKMEETSILKVLEPSEYLILLDERGKEFTTEQLADHWQVIQDSGQRNVAVVVGGAYGVTAELRQKADLVLALSQLTFPHQFVRAVLYEQLYRIFTVLKNEPYHH